MMNDQPMWNCLMVCPLDDMTSPTTTVWMTNASGGRSPDRICDTLATGQRLCDDFLAVLYGTWTVVEDWAQINSPESPVQRWVRYTDREGQVVQQSIVEMVLDRDGAWYST